ncbi:MAG TPA: SusC/RagA family TonB-linked outer membrane protein [Gemmatimonadaceae bacterium]|jgi:TonB-linked SusC/RagA family outer membrane protein
MSARVFRALTPITVAAFALLASASTIHAQAGTIAGHVRAVGTNEPLSGAQIVVVSGQQRAVSDENGAFRISGVSGTTVTLDVRHIGYRSERVPARVGQQDVGVSLMVNPAALDAIVVTGQPGAAQRREIGNAVGVINASDIVATAPILDTQGLLNGRTTSLVVMPTSGQVGTGSQVRIRGLSSLSLGNSPLLFVDGVRVNNDPATGPISQSFGSSPISRLNDFNPEDIESIEVLKGPSAATLYGTEAANGVINIITKKGSSRTTRWNLNVRQGMNSFANYQDRFPQNYGRARLTTDLVSGAATGPVVPLNFDSLLVGACGDSIATRTGKKCDIFKDGRHQEAEASVSGGVGNLNYYSSGGLLDDRGVEGRNRKLNYSGRLNVNFAPSQKINLSTNVGYVTGPTNLPCDAGCGGYTWTTLSATPNNYNLSTRHGFHSNLPYQYDQIVNLWQDLGRTTASFKIEHNPLSWLSHRLTLGGDITEEGNNEWDPRIDSLGSTGFRDINQREVVNRYLDYSATATYNYKPSIKFTTSAGAQYFTSSIHSTDASGSTFPTPGLKSVTATVTRNPGTESFADDKSLGFYAQEQLGWRDRLFLVGALRSDDHSAFGADFDRVYYPKFSASYVISDEPWFHVPVLGKNLDQLRLRFAYGSSGKAPQTYSAIKTYNPTAGPGDAAAVTPNTIGNPDLGPEKSKELETGFDLTGWGGRAGAEVTYYNKKTTDAILDQIVAPSTGQSGTKPINIGGILNTGWEFNLHGTPISRRNLSLDLGGQFSMNDNKVTSLGNQVGAQNFVVAGTYVRQQVGYPVFSWFEKRVVTTQINRTTGATSNPMCSTVNADGSENSKTLMPCAGVDGKYGTADDAPSVYLGRSVPPREMSFNGNLGLWNRFHISTMFDIKNGQKKLDGNTRVRCAIFGRCPENMLGIAGDPLSQQFAASVDSIRAVESNSSSNLVDYLITNSSFARWRELTVSFDVPDRYVAKTGASRASMSLSGRNLALWTNYQGFEPEAMFLGGTRGGNVAWEQTTLPQLRTWIFSFNLTF